MKHKRFGITLLDKLADMQFSPIVLRGYFRYKQLRKSYQF
jgi:hypothetical protein